MTSKNFPLISNKHFSEFTPQDFLSHVEAMYQAPKAKKGPRKIKVAKVAPGLTLTRTKKGALSLRCSRAEKTVTRKEIMALACEHKITQQELWTLFTKKQFQIVEG